MKSPITTHVLDTARGAPASGVAVGLERLDEGGQGWRRLASGWTDDDGRMSDLLPADHSLAPGVYRLSFEVDGYFRDAGLESFYRAIPIVFEVRDTTEHYHVPLLLSPWGYSTYRGS